MAEGTVTYLSWHKCYKQGWGQDLVPEAYSHPAKVARGLARKIYAHAIEQGWLKEGDCCLDPFAGIGGFALDALANGLDFVGVELEQNFVDMGGGCDCTGISKDDWARCFGRWDRFRYKDGRHWCPRCLAEAEGVIEPGPPTLPGMGPEPTASYERNSGKIPHTEPHRYAGNLDLFARHARDGARAVLVQGDSRNLVEVLEGARAEGIIASPPYTGSLKDKRQGGGIDESKRKHTRKAGPRGQTNVAQCYGTDPAQLGNMPTGEPPSAMISSPPYANSLSDETSRIDESKYKNAKSRKGQHRQVKLSQRYSPSPANLGNLPTGEPPQAIIGSPPHGHDTEPHGDLRPDDGRAMRRTAERNYGESDGQLAAMREGDVDAVIASPPYGQAGLGKVATYKDPEKLEKEIARALAKGGVGSYYGNAPGQLGIMQEGEPPQAVIASPPYTGDGVGHDAGHPRLDAAEDERREAEGCGRRPAYGTSNGQLGAMREGNVDAVIASPPYAASATKGDRENRAANLERAGIDSKNWLGQRRCAQGRSEGYGQTDGQLAALPEGEPPAGIVSSPPWESTEGSLSAAKFRDPEGSAERKAEAYRTGKIKGHGASKEAILREMQKADQSTYGHDPNNLGNQQGDTFWAASRLILLQCHQVLAPGGVAIWVLKAFIRNRKVVDFPGQWQSLCESCGFETVEIIRAWLIEERGTQYDLEGEAHTKIVERKSFFRRLAEKKGSPRIDYEIVLITQKPS